MSLRQIRDLFYCCEAGEECLNHVDGKGGKGGNGSKSVGNVTLHGLSCPLCDCALACSDKCPAGLCVDCCATRKQRCHFCQLIFDGFHCGHHFFFNPRRMKQPTVCPTCARYAFSAQHFCGACGALYKGSQCFCDV